MIFLIFLEFSGNTAWLREVLNMSVRTSASWSEQSLSSLPRILYRHAAFFGLILDRVLFMSHITLILFSRDHKLVSGTDKRAGQWGLAPGLQQMPDCLPCIWLCSHHLQCLLLWAARLDGAPVFLRLQSSSGLSGGGDDPLRCNLSYASYRCWPLLVI